MLLSYSDVNQDQLSLAFEQNQHIGHIVTSALYEMILSSSHAEYVHVRQKMQSIYVLL